MQPLIDWLAPGQASIDVAIRAGWRAQTVGAAFLPAYRAALQALIPGIGPDAEACLCVTEVDGNHPRSIHTTLRDGRLNGQKSWTTGGAEGRIFLVAARVGDADGRPVLKLVKVAANAPGVSVTPMPPTPFVPDVSHCSVAFGDVEVPAADVLPGDGYADYIKPFRTVEDIHVFAGLAAWWLSVGTRNDWPPVLRGELIQLLISLSRLSEADPRASETHVALGGAIAAAERLVQAMEPHWQNVDAAVRDGWLRDRAIMRVASGARKKRFERAVLDLQAR